MRALVFRGTRQTAVEDWPVAELRPGHVRVAVTTCGICGTDLHVYKGMPANWPIPGVRGHEFAGTIIELGADVEDFGPGDRVVIQPLLYCGECRTCRAGQTNLCSSMSLIGGELPGGYAEQVIVPASSLFRIPDNLDLSHAALVETLATPVHAFRQLHLEQGSRVAVLGVGAQGLFAAQLSRLHDASYIAVTDVVPHRLEVATQFGVGHVIDASERDPVQAILEATDGEGVDLVIEAAGLRQTRQQAVNILRPGGTAIFLALGTAETPIDFMQVVPKELHLRGTQCYTDADFAHAIDLLSEGQIQVDALTTEMALDAGPKAFEMLSTNPGEAIKVVLRP